MQQHGDADAAGPRDAERPLPVLAYLEDGDVDDNLAARLVQVVNELLREEKLVGRGTHDDGVLALHAVDLGIGQYVTAPGATQQRRIALSAFASSFPLYLCSRSCT